MDKDIYSEDLLDLVENAIGPLEKYFSTLIDIGAEDQEPRRIFVDDIGKTGIALVNHAQDDLRAALELLFQKIGRITVKRAAYDNRMGVRPRKILDVDVGGNETEQAFAKH